MIRFFKTPWFTRIWFPSLIWNIKSRDSIYLTFDDGPNPTVTPWVLEKLKEVNAKATFFCLGKKLEAHPALAQTLLNEGHQIGNHTYSHCKGWKNSDSDYLQEVKLCDDVMEGLEIKSDLFRPPYGRIKRSQLQKMRNKKVIMWSHLSWDFDVFLRPGRSIEKLKRAKAGSILVFHDSEKAFENLKIILPEILAHFKSKGFKFEVVK